MQHAESSILGSSVEDMVVYSILGSSVGRESCISFLRKRI
jgi:hypothetical protein